MSDQVQVAPSHVPDDKPTASSSLAISGNLIDVMIDVASRNPRNIEIVLQNVKQEIAIVPELAKRCYYSIPFRSDDDSKKLVEGPSIKLANIVSRLFKNVVVSGRISDDEPTRVKVEGLCYDLENNVLRTAPISVSKTYKPRDTTGGIRFFPTDQLNRQVQAGISKGIRNAVFNVVPAWLIDICFQYAKELALNPPIKQGGIVKSVQQRILDAKTLFKKDYKITDGELSAYIADYCDTLDDNALLAHLIGLDTALQEGQKTADEVFRPKSAEAASGTGMPQEKKTDIRI